MMRRARHETASCHGQREESVREIRASRRCCAAWAVLPVLALAACNGSEPSGEPTRVRSAELAGWEATLGALGVARHEASAALLGDGKVMVCGGTSDGSAALSSCDRYDPMRGVWTATAPMTTARRGGTSTVLGDGRVLVCGGGTAQCELYSPSSGTWTAAAAMSVSRTMASAALLGDGRVLMAAGEETGSAQLYDPGTNQWSSAGTSAGVTGAAAVRLGDGRVMLIGGKSGIVPQPGVRIFDPSSASWTTGPALPTARAEHTATRTRSGKVVVAGGTSGGAALGTVHVYDPGAGTWSTPAAGMTEPRRGHAAVLLPSDRVLLLGGIGQYGALDSTVLYDSGAQAFSDGPLMKAARERALVAVLGSGDVLVAGGKGTAPLASSELFKVDAICVPMNPMAAARRHHAASILPSGKLLVAGGTTDGNDALASCEVLDPATGTWASAASMNVARREHAAVLMPDGNVLVSGGVTSGGMTQFSAEVYIESSNQWINVPNMKLNRYSHTASLLHDGRVIVASYGSAEIYNPATNAWADPLTMVGPSLEDHSAVVLGDGRLMLVGGGGSAKNSAVLFDPKLGTWVGASAIPNEHFWFDAVLLATGEVMAVNGNTSGVSDLYEPSTNVWTTPIDETWRHEASATRTASGKVAVAGGRMAGNAMADTTLFDRATKQWRSSGAMASPRFGMTVAQLSNGHVAAVGGGNYAAASSAVDRLDPGLAFLDAWRPTIASVDSPMKRGATVVAQGTGFRGATQAHGGTANSAASDLPIVVLDPIGGSLPRWIMPSSFSDTSVTFVVPADFPHDHAWLRVFVAGIPSVAVLIKVVPKAQGDGCGQSGECASAHCVDGVCCQNACTAPCMSCANAGGTCDSF
ncbi:MAG TPA: kelch repeat-containing protein, partial [Polyangiaceae bacterium]|nr:kelch repeat-containing protein [Polyangiaceae bacterium]